MTFSFLTVFLGQPNFTGGYKHPQSKTRRVKEVLVHPRYSRKPDGVKNLTKEHMPKYDFALIKVNKPMMNYHINLNFKFERTVRPICLPNKDMWDEKFYQKLTTISGYGRIEAKKIPGQEQTALQLKEAHLVIIGRKDERCLNVMPSYILIKAHNLWVKR